MLIRKDVREGRIEFRRFQTPGRPARSGLPRKHFEKRSFAADITLDAVIQFVRFPAVLAPRRHAHAGWSRDQRVDLKRADVEGEGNRTSSARRLVETRTVCPQVSERNKITLLTHRRHIQRMIRWRHYGSRVARLADVPNFGGSKKPSEMTSSGAS